jgi:hypothetical protein
MTDRTARLRWSSSHSVRGFAITILLTCLILTGATFVAQNTVAVVTGDARVDKLLSQMTRYLGAPKPRPGGADFAARALAAFERVHLEAGQSQPVTVHLPPRRLQYWSTAERKWVKAIGKRDVMVGGSSATCRWMPA